MGGANVGHSSVEDSLATPDLVKWHTLNKPALPPTRTPKPPPPTAAATSETPTSTPSSTTATTPTTTPGCSIMNDSNYTLLPGVLTTFLDDEYTSKTSAPSVGTRDTFCYPRHQHHHQDDPPRRLHNLRTARGTVCGSIQDRNVHPNDGYPELMPRRRGDRCCGKDESSCRQDEVRWLCRL